MDRLDGGERSRDGAGRLDDIRKHIYSKLKVMTNGKTGTEEKKTDFVEQPHDIVPYFLFLSAINLFHLLYYTVGLSFYYFIVKKLEQSHPGKKANICLPLANIQPFSLFHCQMQGFFRVQDSPRMIVAGQED